MSPKFNRVLILCPGNAITAGPEAIHQLVFDLNRLGCNSSIVYFPYDRAFSTPGPYKKYNVPVSNYQDLRDELIIFPEIITTYALKVKNAKAAIWWMSVNNYTCNRYGNPIRDKFRYFKNFLKGLRPIGGLSALKRLEHFAQSYYALDFLKKNSIDAKLLSDPIPFYTENSYLESLKNISDIQRKNIILYNPNKGGSINKQLIEHFKYFNFFPLVGYDRKELADIFLSSKLYIDFGHHPGKDRLPREAAIHGCCVITGLYGSASNPYDVNIPSYYKLDPTLRNFFESFELLVDKIFTNFKNCQADFLRYRETIAQEQINFDKQIFNIFFK